MKQLSGDLQAHLEQGLTTLCYCWRLSLANGARLGFTDHDEALTFDGTTFEAQAGFSATEIESSLGLSIDNLEATGALSSLRISEDALQAGDFDGAEIEIWKVNWQDVSQRVLERKGHLGEVSYGQGAFKAELRGLAHQLNQKRGRLYAFGCDAALGDARCKVNLAGFTATGHVTVIDDSRLEVSGISAFADDWFTRGTIQIGIRKLDVKRHRAPDRIELWQQPKFAINVGDEMLLVAGCDKQLSTCTAKFGNAINFRGFPHMPGNDFVAAVAAQSDPNNDGGKRS